MIPEAIYLSAYLMVADERIYDVEWKILKRLISDSSDNSEEVYQNTVKIILSDDEKPQLAEIYRKASQLTHEEKLEILRTVMLIGLLEDDLNENEYDFVRRLFRKLEIPLTQFRRLRTNGKELVETYRNESYDVQLNIDDPEKYENHLNELIGAIKTDARFSQNQMRELKNQVAAFNDSFANAENNIDDSLSSFRGNQLKTETDRLLKTVDEQMEEVLKKVDSELSKQAAALKTSAQYFTVSFMGRSKAGKSTLHSVLLNGSNNELIGSGKLGTTRFNYVYQWNQLRIIDTPGIGVPNGKTDVETAKSIIDESDLICYVVSSDGILTSEFDFLSEIKAQNKPMLIILNYKDNYTRTKKKYDRFIEDPLRWYTNTGENSISDHFERINKYVSGHISNSLYQIIPVFLLAAKDAINEEDEYKKQQLIKGSRINEFWKALEEQIIDYGVPRKTQTILDGAIYHVSQCISAVDEIINTANQIYAEVDSSKTAVMKSVEDEYTDTRKNLNRIIDNAYGELISKSLFEFCELHYTGQLFANINEKWNEYYQNLHFEENLERKINLECERFNNTIRMIKDEGLGDVNFTLSQLNDISLHSNMIIDIKSIATLLGDVMVIGAPFVGGSSKLIKLAVAVAGGAIHEQAKHLKGNEVKLKKERDDLYRQLVEIFQEKKQKDKRFTQYHFKKNADSSKKNIEEAYGNIILTLDPIRTRLSIIKQFLASHKKQLEQRYAAKIINYMYAADVVHAEGSDVDQLMSVEYEHGRFLSVKLNKKLRKKPLHSKKEIADILQHKFTLDVLGE